MSKNSRGGPSRQKEGNQRSRSRSPRTLQPNIIQLSHNVEPSTVAQIPWGKKISPLVQNNTNQTSVAPTKIEETPKASEVRVSMPVPSTFELKNPQPLELTPELTVSASDPQDTVSVNSIHVEVSLASPASELVEEPKGNEYEPMDIEVKVTEEVKEEEKIVPPSLESHSPIKVTKSSPVVESLPQEPTDTQKLSPVQETKEKVSEEVKEETEHHVYKQGEEFEAPDGSKFRVDKLNHKNDEQTQVHCMKCNRSIQKKSIKGHIATKIHKGH